MIRLGIMVISKSRSTGAYNYLLNLVRLLNEFAAEQVHCVLFFGEDFESEQVAAFEELKGASVVRSRVFDESARQASLLRGLIFGMDSGLAKVFANQKLDVIFETAQFFGWRLRTPVIAWLTDFQHRNLSHLFSRLQYARRELGFQAQVRSGRIIMVSSEDAQRDCEKFYPTTRGRVRVVRFAVRATPSLDVAQLGEVRERYQLPDQFFFLPNQFWIHKNHTCVIEAVARLKVQGIEVVVAASGNKSDPRDASHMNKLEARITEARLSANFRLLGMIPMPDVKALMQACTALINPSFSEGWSTPVEEAKANGVPLILSGLPVHIEQARDRALFFDPNRPAELAEILKAYVPKSPLERERGQVAAAADSERAVQQYVRDFLDVLRAALNR